MIINNSNEYTLYYKKRKKWQRYGLASEIIHKKIGKKTVILSQFKRVILAQGPC